MNAMVVAAVINAAGSVMAGSQAQKTAQANQRATEAAANLTAQNTLYAGIENAAIITAAARANNATIQALASFNAEQDWDLAKYNSDLRMMVSDYNAQIIEREAFDIWEAAEVDILHIANQAKRSEGDVLAAYGASGAQINETDSVADALIDVRTQAELDKFIVRHGADIQAQKVTNEAARSRWDGLVTAQQIAYEGGQRSIGGLMNAAISMLGNAAQSGIDAAATMTNASRNAASIRFSGQVTGAQYSAQGSQAFNNGMFTAAGTLASSYINSRAPESRTQTQTQTTSSYQGASAAPSQGRIAPTTYTTSSGTRYTASLLED